MNVEPLNVREEDALVALREYRAHRDVYDKRDWEIERIYRAISKGNKVISVQDAIVRAGLDEKKRPKLAICRADAVWCRFDGLSDHGMFGIVKDRLAWRRGSSVRVEWPDVGWASATAQVPRIPPQHRPTTSALSNYHILWEADWQDVPRDPYLLRKIGKDAWVVLAAWDLTEVELSVLRAHQVRQ